MPVYELRRGAETYGHAVGVLMLEADEPYIPGDVSNASTFNYPVLYRRVPGATVERTTTGDPELAEAVAATARELESQGVGGITSNCGFMLKFQKAAASAVKVPVFLSSLLQLPFVAATTDEGRPIGVVTAMSNRLGNDLLELAGVRPETPIVVAGLQDRPEFRGVLEIRGRLDFRSARSGGGRGRPGASGDLPRSCRRGARMRASAALCPRGAGSDRLGGL